MTTHEDLARAFSGHRFEQTVDHLAEDVRWVLVGQSVIEGRDAVAAACRSTADELTGVTTTFRRFVTAASGEVAVVDAVGVYDGPEDITAVSSCDIYEFAGEQITTITSYAVEVDPDDAGAPPPQTAVR